MNKNKKEMIEKKGLSSGENFNGLLASIYSRPSHGCCNKSICFYSLGLSLIPGFCIILKERLPCRRSIWKRRHFLGLFSILVAELSKGI